MFCESCGNQIGDNAKFCAKCGQQTTEIQNTNEPVVRSPEPSQIVQKPKMKLKMKMVFVCTALVVVLVSIFLVINSRKNANDNKYERGNTVGNLSNFGSVAQSGDWIYYVIMGAGDENGIYRIRTDGTDQMRLTYESGVSINVVGEWVYYTSINMGLYKMRIDGSDNMRFKTEDGEDIAPGYFTVVGDWIYYVKAVSERGIYKIRTDGSDQTILIEDGGGFINVAGDWIYYSISGDDGIYKIRTDGTDQTKISGDRFDSFSVVGDWIYYLEYGTSDLYKIRIDGTGKTRLSDNRFNSFNVDGDWIYYINKNDEMKPYKMRIDGTDNTKLNDDQIGTRLNAHIMAGIFVVDDWVWYSTTLRDELVFVVYKIRTDGSDRQRVHTVQMEKVALQMPIK